MAIAGLPLHHPIPGFDDLGLDVLVTTREAGTFGFPEQGEAPEATARWHDLQRSLAESGVPRLASAKQVHGTEVLRHQPTWEGWVRHEGADGHLLFGAGGLAVTVADCVPVFLAHEDGPVGAVHAGWRGVAGGILGEAVRALEAAGHAPAGLRVHFGPSICGRCYEVGPEVYRQLTGLETQRPRNVDLRALLGEQARSLGVGRWSADLECTRCDNDRFFSHRAGDAGRQIGVIVRLA